MFSLCFLIQQGVRLLCKGVCGYVRVLVYKRLVLVPCEYTREGVSVLRFEHVLSVYLFCQHTSSLRSLWGHIRVGKAVSQTVDAFTESTGGLHHFHKHSHATVPKQHQHSSVTSSPPPTASVFTGPHSITNACSKILTTYLYSHG